MPHSLTADMAREGLRPLFERTDRPQGFTQAEAREVLDNAALPLFVLEGFWEHAKELMARGVERGTLLAILADLADLIEHCTAAFDRVLAEARALGLSPDEVASLDRTTQAVRRMRGVVAGRLRWLEAPLPPVDPASVPAVAGGAKVEGFVGLDEFAARLRGGGSA